MTTQNNSVALTGFMAKDDDDPEFIFSHEANGEKFFSFTLEVERISGTKDYLPVIISERLIDAKYTYADIPLYIVGQFRSFNQKGGAKVHQKLYVFAKDIYTVDEYEPMNEIYISGFVCKEPVYRVTPLGREITDLMLAVPRLCGKTDYIPCICWGRNAVYASRLPISTQITISGRIQSREYQKVIDNVPENKTAYEISIVKIHGE